MAPYICTAKCSIAERSQTFCWVLTKLIRLSELPWNIKKHKNAVCGNYLGMKFLKKNFFIHLAKMKMA